MKKKKKKRRKRRTRKTRRNEKEEVKEKNKRRRQKEHLLPFKLQAIQTRRLSRNTNLNPMIPVKTDWMKHLAKHLRVEKIQQRKTMKKVERRKNQTSDRYFAIRSHKR
jgi:hypothetical protein